MVGDGTRVGNGTTLIAALVPMVREEQRAP
jgi:hypothetical protein